MYKCTEQLEALLIERRRRINEQVEQAKQKAEAEKEQAEQEEQARAQQSHGQQTNDDDDVIVEPIATTSSSLPSLPNPATYSEQDIQKGTAKLESLLEHIINKNYDKLEVYTMRNILTIPQELIDEGYIRLRHHEGLKVVSSDEIRQIDEEYEKKLKETTEQIKVNRYLNELIVKFTKMVDISTKLRDKLISMDYEGKVDESGRDIVEKYDLNPLRETYKFLVEEMRPLSEPLSEAKWRVKWAGKEGGREGN
ncbi:DEKNAAC104224 [Brettanomyces naardenensis]|uniref:DEKNAAC104224 n=1 Tax=Brettanomyces naardenensis TaxID=13370 RepID=A0A448YQP8_BRENA|nr:DEKNAAC104224 [Brettanomyces naardenensis]